MGYNEVNKNSGFHWSLSQNSDSVAAMNTTIDKYRAWIEPPALKSTGSPARGQWQSSSTQCISYSKASENKKKTVQRESTPAPLQRPQLARLPERIQVVVSYACNLQSQHQMCEGSPHYFFSKYTHCVKLYFFQPGSKCLQHW